MLSHDNIPKVIQNLRLRNIEAFYIADKHRVLDKISELIPPHSTVGIGNSQTLKQLEISSFLAERGNIVYDKTQAQSPKETITIKKKALLTNWYVTGTNAISVEGHIVNIDHSGNRVAAMIYGPDQVLIIVGVNKFEETLQQAINRARTHAAPLNARRVNLSPPCLELNRCIDCRSKDRVCNNLVIIEGQHIADRMKVIIVGEEMGY